VHAEHCSICGMSPKVSRGRSALSTGQRPPAGTVGGGPPGISWGCDHSKLGIKTHEKLLCERWEKAIPFYTLIFLASGEGILEI